MKEELAFLVQRGRPFRGESGAAGRRAAYSERARQPDHQLLDAEALETVGERVALGRSGPGLGRITTAAPGALQLEREPGARPGFG